MRSILSKSSHRDHWTTTLRQTCDENDKLVCFACKDSVICGPTYIIETEDHRRFCFHKSCAELPGEIQHSLHPHPLTVSRRRCFLFICDGCRHVSFGFKYSCKECKFQLDFQCVSKNEGQALKETVEKHTIYHPHKLQLVYFRSLMSNVFCEYLFCCCCLKSCPYGRSPTYACNIVCIEHPFFIHESCLDILPRLVQSSFHPEHPLFIYRVDDGYHSCQVCKLQIIGLGLTCDQCDIQLHVSCGSRTARGLRLNLHQHDMLYVISNSQYLYECTICKADVGGAFYRCVRCNVNVECIPIAQVVEHESHDHPLKLTESVVTHRNSDEYRCDICEEEGDIKHHSYYCNECNYIAHIECVHSEREVDTSPKISSLEEPRDKGKEEEETEDVGVEIDDADEETDDAEEKTKYEIDDIDSISQDEWDSQSYSSFSISSEQFPGGLQYHALDADESILNIKRRVEELALQLEADANLDKRMQNFRADLVAIVFQLEDLRQKFSHRII